MPRSSQIHNTITFDRVEGVFTFVFNFENHPPRFMLPRDEQKQNIYLFDLLVKTGAVQMFILPHSYLGFNGTI